MMLSIIFLNACGSVESSITAQLAAGNKETRITDITPANPKAGDTVTLSGKRFPTSTKNLIGRVVLADGGTKDSTLTVTSDNSAWFTVPTDTASEVKTILMMHDGKTMATFDIKVTPVGTFDALTFSPAAGTYAGSQSVTISSTQPDATIYYTTDGNAPTTSSSTYSSAITVSSTQTVKAYAVKANYSDSGVGVAAYTINGAVATPTFSVAQGSYGPAQSVTLSSATAGATIYYTTDGTTPTTGSSVYASAISVSSTQTIKTYGVKANYSDYLVERPVARPPPV